MAYSRKDVDKRKHCLTGKVLDDSFDGDTEGRRTLVFICEHGTKLNIEVHGNEVDYVHENNHWQADRCVVCGFWINTCWFYLRNTGIRQIFINRSL